MNTKAGKPEKSARVLTLHAMIHVVLAWSAAGFMVFGLIGTWFLLSLGVVFILGRFLSTLIHEIGHAIGALLVGWRIVVITVWPFAFHAPSFSIVASSRVNTHDGGGFVSAVPPSPASDTTHRYVVFVLLGPLASLAATLWLAFTAFGPPQLTHTLSDYGTPLPIGFRSPELARTMFCFLIAMALLNLDVFLRTAIPVSASAQRANDARLILNALRTRRHARYGVAGWIGEMVRFKTRFRNIPDWMYAHARGAEPIEGVDASMHDGIDVSRALDARNVDAVHARARIEHYRANHESNDWLITCDAWLAVIHEDNLPHAEAMLASLKGQSNNTALLAATRAAVAARHGRTSEVEKELALMEAELKKQSPFPNPTFRDIRKTVEKLARAH